MKKFFTLMMVLVLVFALAACGKKEEDKPVDPQPEEKKIKVCFITQQLGDNSFADASDITMKQYVEKYGIEYKCTQVGAGGDQLAATREAAQNGFDIVAVGYDVDVIANIEKEAANYPDTTFYFFSAKNNYTPVSDNVVTGYFQSCQSSYVGGLVAGKMSKTGRCAFVGGQENVGLYDWMIGYVQGVERGGSIAVYSWINGDNPWSDPAKAKELSLALYNNYNADIFWGCAGQSGDGVFEAVLQLREQTGNNDMWALGVDSDQYAVFMANDRDETAEVILTSCMKNPVGPVAAMIETLQAGGKIKGGMLTCGAADGTCTIADNDFYRAHASKEAQDLVNTVRAELAAGTAQIVTAYGLSIEELNEFLKAHTLNYQQANI